MNGLFSAKTKQSLTEFRLSTVLISS